VPTLLLLLISIASLALSQQTGFLQTPDVDLDDFLGAH
jgi:hypothetical protein